MIRDTILFLLLAPCLSWAEEPQCIQPTELQITRLQREDALNRLAATIAQANAAIEKIQKELDAVKAKPKETK